MHVSMGDVLRGDTEGHTEERADEGHTETRVDGQGIQRDTARCVPTYERTY